MAHVPPPPGAQAAAPELAPERVRSAFSRYVLGVASRRDKEEIRVYLQGVRQQVAKTGGRAASSLEFEGNRVYMQKFFVASFPGIYEGVWQNMSEGPRRDLLSCACVFFQDTAGGVNGKHGPGAKDGEECLCKFLRQRTRAGAHAADRRRRHAQRQSRG